MTCFTIIQRKPFIKTMGVKASLAFAMLLFFTVIQFSCTSERSPEDQKPLTVFLVRHAEKVDGTAESELTEQGKERAQELAKMLRSANIEYIHSSDFVRTRKTAAPTAMENGLTTEIYDHRDLKQLARKLKEKGGTHLVVGHSDTTPKMVSLLGSDLGKDKIDGDEYDRLYIVVDPGDGNVNAILMRFGEPYDEQ